jgi:hypothetical protein
MKIIVGKFMNEQNKQIIIAVACDGFTIIHNNTHYWINQEDDPSVKLKELFETMGFEVEVEEDY